MSILVISDTHGLVEEVKQVAQRHAPEVIFHCGDFCTDRTQEPFATMRLVRGNCDVDTEAAEELLTDWRGLTIYQTHGHLYGVKQSLLRLNYRAEETGANVVLFGHSHVPVCGVERGILFLNPGSLLQPRGYAVPTYALVERAGETKEGIELEVRFYGRDGRPRSDLGGRFAVRR